MTTRIVVAAAAAAILLICATPALAVGPEMKPPASHPGPTVTPDTVVPPDLAVPTGSKTGGKDSTFTGSGDDAAARESKLSEPDRSFVIQAGHIGVTEVAAANVALDHASNPKVKDFAKMMVEDHALNNEQLRGLAERDYVKIGQIDDKNTAKLEALRKASGSDFDRAYMADMVQGHRAAIDLFEGASKDVADGELKAYIEGTLPALRKHLAAAQSIASDVANDASPGAARPAKKGTSR